MQNEFHCDSINGLPVTTINGQSLCLERLDHAKSEILNLFNKSKISMYDRNAG